MEKNTLSQDSELLTEIAVAYYQDEITQEEIARKFGISRIKVGRLLKRAREEGIVEINVRYHPVFSTRLEQQLQTRFPHLQRALIALDSPDSDEQRRQVAALVSAHLAQSLKDNAIVAVGQGRNVAAVADYPGQVPTRNCLFISGIGGTHRPGDAINADHISRRLAKSLAASAKPCTPRLTSKTGRCVTLSCKTAPSKRRSTARGKRMWHWWASAT